MDSTDDWNGNCQVLENEIEEIEDEKVNQIIPGYASFHDYVQV